MPSVNANKRRRRVNRAAPPSAGPSPYRLMWQQLPRTKQVATVQWAMIALEAALAGTLVIAVILIGRMSTSRVDPHAVGSAGNGLPGSAAVKTLSGASAFCENAATFGTATADLFSLGPQKLELFDTKFKTAQPVLLSFAPSSITSDLRKIFSFDNRLFSELSKEGWQIAWVPRSYSESHGLPRVQAQVCVDQGDQIPRHDLRLQADRALMGAHGRLGRARFGGRRGPVTDVSWQLRKNVTLRSGWRRRASARRSGSPDSPRRPWCRSCRRTGSGCRLILSVFARSSTFCWAALTVDGVACVEEGVDAEAGDALGGGGDHAVVEPAGVLDALVVVEELGVVEDSVLLRGGELGGLAADRVGADERPRLHLDLHLAGPDVVLDERSAAPGSRTPGSRGTAGR